MKNIRLHVLSAWCLAFCLPGVVPAVTAQPEIEGKVDSSKFTRIPKDTDDWTRHFRIGALVGMNIGASFNEKGLFNSSGNGSANGIFDDGFVLTDQTGNAGGYTGYWGYNNSSQYNAVNQTLQMHSTASYSTTGSANANGGLFPGFDMAYGENLWYWKHARVGWELGFGLLPVHISENSAMSAVVNQTTYTFNTGGIVMPPAPYQGGFSGQGEPIISTNYTSTVSQSPGTVSSTQTLDVMLYTLRLGPSFYWDLTDHVGVSLGAGPAVGIVSGDYKYNELVTVGGVGSRNTGRIGGTDLIFGGYVNAAVMYHVVENGDLYAGVQFMPMTGATISGGGREGRLKLGGQLYFSVGINWPF